MSRVITTTSKTGNGNGNGNGHAKAGHPPTFALLCVVVACHGIAVAIPVERVLRLVLPDQLQFEEESGGGHSRIVRVDDERFVVANLGELLGLAPLGDAAVLLKIPHENTSVTIALMTGACLVVDHVQPEMSFPALAFRARGSAFLGAFNAKSVKATSSSYGVLIDPSALIDPGELSSALRELAQGQGT